MLVHRDNGFQWMKELNCTDQDIAHSMRPIEQVNTLTWSTVYYCNRPTVHSTCTWGTQGLQCIALSISISHSNSRSHDWYPLRPYTAPVLINPSQESISITGPGVLSTFTSIEFLTSLLVLSTPRRGIARVNMLIPFYEVWRSPISNTYICSTIIRPFLS